MSILNAMKTAIMVAMIAVVAPAPGRTQDDVVYPRFMDHQRFEAIVKFFNSPPPVTAESSREILAYHRQYREYVNRYSQEMTDVEQAAKNGIRKNRGASLIDLARYSFQQGAQLAELTEVLTWELQSGPDRDVHPRSMLFILWPEMRSAFRGSDSSSKGGDRRPDRGVLRGAKMAVAGLLIYANLEARSWERDSKRINFEVSPVSERVFFVRHAGRITEEDVSMWLALYRSLMAMAGPEKTISQDEEQKYQKMKEMAMALSAVFHFDASKIVDSASLDDIAEYYDAVCFQELRRQVLDNELAAKLLAAGAPVHKD